MQQMLMDKTLLRRRVSRNCEKSTLLILLMARFLAEVLTYRLLCLGILADLLLPEACCHCEPDCDTSERHLCGCALPLQWRSWCPKGFALQQLRQLMVGAL